MRTSKRHSTFSRLVPVLITLLLVWPIAAGGPVVTLAEDQASPQSVPNEFSPPSQGIDAAVDCGDTACPSPDYAGLDKCVERTKFCVYYTTDSISEAEAEDAADWVELYWNRFVALGFNEPKYTPTLEVYLSDITGDCNGGTGWSSDEITTYAGCLSLYSGLVMRMTLGHELTHRVQYNYDTFAGAPRQTKFLKEGSARATQDNWFDDTDDMAAAAAPFTYCAEASDYLAWTNSDLSALWYKACLWWKWSMEQYGTVLTEPQRGIDFVEAVYHQNELGKSSIAAVNGALAIKAPGTTFDDSFQDFVVAAYTKDLTGLPDDSYNILDEEEGAGPGTCGMLSPQDKGAISTGTSRVWNNEAISRYGVEYYEANVGATCPVVTASFHTDSGPAFFHVVTQDVLAFKQHVRGSGTDWTQSFLNDGSISKVVAIAGSLGSSSVVDVTLECADPVLDIKLPNAGAKAWTQPNTKFLAQVLVTNGSPTGPVVGGLTNSDFAARVNGVNAAVTGGGFIQEQYWLVIRTPAGLADGTYDLEVILEEPGSDTPVDTDTEFGAVEVTTDKVDHVLVIDRSGSMGEPIEPTDDKLKAAKSAAVFYVDITRNNDGLAVVAYNHDVDPAPFDMQTVNATVRTSAKNYINNWATGGIFPSGATSIGDGLDRAATQRSSVSTTGNPLCSFVLLSDGYENQPQYWSTVKSTVQATNCPVTSIAFGPDSNEPLMQSIATDTGGSSYYNDVYVSALDAETDASRAAMNLELADTYEYAHGIGEGRQRLLSERGQVSKTVSETHEVMIDDSINEVLFALDWFEVEQSVLLLSLRKPDGTLITPQTLPYTFPDNWNQSGADLSHLGWRIPNPEPGKWELIVQRLAGDSPVNYMVLVSGQTHLTLNWLGPNLLGREFFTGNSFPLFAILSNDGPMAGVPISATVEAPELGCPGFNRTTVVALKDDGQHGDGAAGDGVYANTYTKVNCAEAVTPAGEGVPNPPAPNDEGGYQVTLMAGDGRFQRMTKGAFAVLEGNDTNNNGLPDPWEAEHGVSDPNSDPDLDYLSTGDEYLFGTDPNNSDTDGGGENDGSEVDWVKDPLDPSDDEVAAPDFFQAAADVGKVKLTYDVKLEYARMELWRAPAAAGPWILRKAELPLDGMYEDPALNDNTFFYRLIGEDSAVLEAPGHRSAVLDSTGVTPSVDPFPPMAEVIINGGAPSTMIRDVTLSFAAYEKEAGDPDQFSDITHMIVSNDPTFSGASWEALAQDVPWALSAMSGELATVYVRFRDANDNETVGTETGVILFNPYGVYIPVVMR